MNPRERLQKLEELARLKREWAMLGYKPYKKQVEFHALLKRERAMLAGNQLGKTLAAGHEVAFHMTGLYPDWWKGVRFSHPVRCWVGSETAEATKVAQKILLGQFTQFGTGTIPKDLLLPDWKLARGTPETVEVFRVKHRSGGLSECGFKAYSDGREKWQGETLDFVWFDEEPPEDIYTEGLTRTNATKGFVFCTFTPLLGMSEVVMRFWDKKEHPDRGMVQMTIDDVGHYSDEDKKRITASYRPHELEARLKGIPIPGAGRVFPIPEDWIVVDDFPIADHWPVIGGLDIGWDHPTAAVKLAIDPETKRRYICADYRAKETTIPLHVMALKPWGEMPWAWPHDGLHHDKKSGEQIAQLYRGHGLKLVSEHAQFPDERGNGVEAGLWSMLQLMQSGQWKVFKSCQLWLEEFRMYHRTVKEGKVEIMKLREDTISASRYAHMMERYARPKIREEQRKKRYDKPHLKYGTSWMSAL